jgi:AcrR family transcriptional regulator
MFSSAHFCYDPGMPAARSADMQRPAAPRPPAPPTPPTPPAPARPAEAPSKGAQTRRAILDAAIARFGREGYRSTSVADITRDASVGGTVAYAYFPSKEALFLAAVDEDAAAVIEEGLSTTMADPGSASGSDSGDWRQMLFFSLAAALERHPLARRLLAGLEPEVTERVLEIPALAELRRACARRLRDDQLAGVARPDIDPVLIADGVVAIMLSLLMSIVQLGSAAAVYGQEVSAVIDAAIGPMPPDLATVAPRRPR